MWASRRGRHPSNPPQDLSEKKLLSARSLVLIAVAGFLVATSFLLSNFTDESSRHLSGLVYTKISPFRTFGSHTSSVVTDDGDGDEDLDLESLPVELEDENPPTVETEQEAAQLDVSKTVVASVEKGKESELDWLSQELPGWHATRYIYDGPGVLYESDGSDNHTVTKNKGREANVYLTYIISHYHKLPDYMVFIHGGRYQTHNDDPMYDTAPEIRNLRLEYVTENGYTPIRCNWNEGCPGPDAKPLLGHKDGFWEIRDLYARTFQAFFPNVTIPETIAAPCCAQFAVTREEVQKIPLRRWKMMRRYIYNSHFSMEAVESMKLGLVLEYMWHLIFGKPAIFCGQPAKECYCKKFGLCDLDCPQKERCNGRVWPPPARKMPDGWPKKHQGKNGWPKDGWWNDSN